MTLAVPVAHPRIALPQRPNPQPLVLPKDGEWVRQLAMKTEAAAGIVGTSIFNAVQKTSITNVLKIMLDLGHPIGMVEEIINGMVFAAAGMNAPHFQYGPYVPTVINALAEAANNSSTPVLLITINGTGVPGPFDDGPTSFPGWVGWAVGSPWNQIYEQFYGGPGWWDNVIWLPCGYPAAVQNMWASVEQGAGASLQQLQTGAGIHPGAFPLGWKVFIFGYSQGAMVANYIGVNYMLNPSGPLHDRYANGDLLEIWNVGDPNREPGRADGNLACGLPLPPEVDGDVTGGICGPGVPSEGILACLTDAQTTALNVKSIVLPGDLYADAPVGSSPWAA